MLIIRTGDGRVDDLGRRRSLSLEWDADNTYRGWRWMYRDGRVDDLGRRRSLSLEWDADNKYRGWEGG